MKRLLYLILILALLPGCRKAPQPSGVPVGGPDGSKGEAGSGPERKDFVVLTPRAAAQVRQLMQQSGARYLRVRVSADYQYKLDLDTRVDPQGDYLGESQGVAVVVDRKSGLSLPAGITVDFISEMGRAGFAFSSPQHERGAADTSVSLVEVRRGFKTTLARRETGGLPAPEPPPKLFRLVRYPAPPGALAAYLTPDPKDGKKHPAIIWITGGDCNSIGAGCWQQGPQRNDQSASAYRKAGIAMMFPALRGGNDNPGVKEGFLGEVDDVLAAAEFLRKQPFVDPDRVYLGGHSTGGTLALLVAECSDCFRAVFSFGPVDDVQGYGPRYNPFALSDRKELRLRAPVLWLHSIRVPVFVFEGTRGNLSSLKAVAGASKNPRVRIFEVKGADHFNLLAPTNRLIAAKVLRDTGPTSGVEFTEEELNRPFVK
jgi:Fe-S cluster assembly iron-binding protein IscA/alpha/beta superfamily hydrolase